MSSLNVRNKMKNVRIGLTFTFFCLFKVIHASETVQNANISDISDLKQTKRDLSYSYSAADIGSKEGTHIKTITVIKNIVDKKEKSIKVDPKLHKDENWGSYFRDNFDSFGKIPQIPDIDDLIDDKNNKKSIDKPVENKSEKSIPEEEIPEGSSTSEVTKELNDETAAESDKKETIEKIPGEVELINSETANLKLKSQSLPQFAGYPNSVPLKRKIEEHTLTEGTKYLTQYSTPQHSVRQYFIQPDKKLNSKDNSKKSSKIVVQPCDRAYPAYDSGSHQQGYPILTGITITNGDNSGNVVKVTTPSGRTYDIPLPTTTNKPPYIAPSLKKTTNFNSSSDSNNNSNNVNNNINIGRPSFNFNNFLGTQPVNIPVNQPVEVPINNPDPTTAAPPPPPNATNFYPQNIPFGYQPPNNQQPNLIPGIPGINQYNPSNNPSYNPLFNKAYNPHANFPNYEYANNQPVNTPYNQPGFQGTQPGFQGIQPGVQGVNTQFQQPTNQQPINQDTSAVTFPNLSDNILNNNNLIVQQNYNNKQFIPPQNASDTGSFSISNNNNINNPAQQPYNRFIPTSNKINYAIPYTSLPKRSNNNNVVKQKGRSRGLRY